MSTLKCCFILLLVVAIPSCSTSGRNVIQETYKPEGTPRLAVIGVDTQVKCEEWRDFRIGLGIRPMLTDALFATGLFRLVEEKPEIRKKLGLEEETCWLAGLPSSPEELSRIASSYGADVVAYATVKSYKDPSSSWNLGPWSQRTDLAQLEVKACLYDSRTKQFVCSTGQGSAKFVAGGAFVEYRDDGRLSTKSLVGEASEKAVDDAVGRLLPGS